MLNSECRVYRVCEVECGGWVVVKTSPMIKRFKILVLLGRFSQRGKIEQPVLSLLCTPAYKDSLGKLRDSNTQFQRFFRIFNSDNPIGKINFVPFAAAFQKYIHENDVSVAIKWGKGINNIQECAISNSKIAASELFKWPEWAIKSMYDPSSKVSDSIQLPFLKSQILSEHKTGQKSEADQTYSLPDELAAQLRDLL